MLVSFALAFTMAVRSRSLRPTKVRALVAAIVRTVLSNPLALFWPGSSPAARAGQPGSH
ncbi:site-specific recombinase family protein [Burkholderia cepacia]|nr:site-specific recombinase family protein [Burkholderia cepacia]